MELRDLRYFETIAELQHLGRATQLLHRTQPALSSAIRRLEDDCGIPLFQRAGRGFQLTDAGTVLLRWARKTRFDVESARREIAELGQGLTGQVRLGIVPTAAQFLLPVAMRQLMAEAPAVTLKTVVGLVDGLKPLLRSGELDVIVGTESPAPDLESVALSSDNIVVAASTSHPVFESRPSVHKLARYRWVLQSPGAPTRDWLDNAFDRLQLPRPQVQVESSMLLLLPALIAETGLLSFVSQHHLLPHAKAGSLREVVLRPLTMKRRIVAAYRRDTYLSPAVRRLVALLKEAGEQSSP